jgi:hypothetical protein
MGPLTRCISVGLPTATEIGNLLFCASFDTGVLLSLRKARVSLFRPYSSADGLIYPTKTKGSGASAVGLVSTKTSIFKTKPSFNDMSELSDFTGLDP